MNIKEQPRNGDLDLHELELLEAARVYEDYALTELRTAGYRITMPRVQVIRALSDTESAMSAYAIHDKIMKAGGKIDVVSVYRIVNTLQEIGLVHYVGLIGGYFPARQSSPKTNKTQVLLCNSCQRIYEMPILPSVETEIEKQSGRSSYNLKTIKVELVATQCPRCAN